MTTMKKSTYILGLNAYHPDSSACIIKDGQLLAAVEEERFRRIKHWSGFPKEAIRYCLKFAGIGLEDLDYIAMNKDPQANIYRKIVYFVLKKPALSLLSNRLRNLIKIKDIKTMLAKEFLISKEKIKAKVVNVEHHRAHLASAFFVSPFKDAAVVSLDGFGDFTSSMVAKGKDNKIKVNYAVNFPHSLGLFYTAITQYLGFKNFGDEYKVMGLSGFGKPTFLKEMSNILKIQTSGRFKLNLSYFSFQAQGVSLEWEDCEPKLSSVFSQKLIELFGPARKNQEEITLRHCDIAASLQVAYENVFFAILNQAYQLTQSKNLSLAGGCALNSLANGKIFERTPFKDIYIQPNASDAGGALGAAYYVCNQLLGGERNFIMQEAYWGPYFSDLEIEGVIAQNKHELSGCIISKVDTEDELCKRSAQFIADGLILGWFQGRMEWGARALGNRSILVDPRRKEMKDVLNERIKKREWFRPFAPSILKEKTGEYFFIDYPDPFMLKVYLIKLEKREIIPAVAHIDGTGRLQTVSEEENPLYYKLIKAFESLTGIPILLNTSFNENEPIVCSPFEAVNCFLRTKMDVLVLGKFIITR